MALFTIGYESITLLQLVDELRQNCIRTVIDVRQNPISRKPGFSKTALSNHIQRAGSASPTLCAGRLIPRASSSAAARSAFHPATKLCVRADGYDRTIHARTLGDCLADLAEVVAPAGVLPETEANNFRRCLADARMESMDARYHIAWEPPTNRWQLTLHVRTLGNRYRVAKAVLPLTFDQFCIIEYALKSAGVQEARNA